MRTISKRAGALYALVLLFTAGVCVLVVTLVTHADEWAMKNANQHLYTNGALTNCGAILDRNDQILAQTVDGKRVYAEDATIRKATLHLMGDPEGYISSGIHSVYNAELVGYSFLNGVYTYGGKGGGNDIKLTVDADLCTTALKALGDHKGTVGLYNYKTGEMLCMTSSPTFDVEKKPKDINTDSSGKYDGVYMNRFLTGLFTPGSTFKIVTAACAIENIPDIYERTFTCTGKLKTKDGPGVTCNGTHGRIGFEKALNVSCNSAFAQIAIELGPEKLTQTANRLGFKTPLDTEDSLGAKDLRLNRMATALSRFDVSTASENDLGWAGIGQYEVLVNPYQELVMLGAIANGGTPVLPYVVQGIENSVGFLGSRGKGEKGATYFSAQTAAKLSDMLRSNVVNYYGDGNFKGMELCAKTGTAEVDGQKPNAWFVGFSRSEKFPVAFVVVVEDAGSGSGVALPIAKKVLQAAYAAF